MGRPLRRRKHRRRAGLALMLAALLVSGPWPGVGLGGDGGAAAGGDASLLVLVTETGRFPITVEVADTPQTRRQGLQGRRALADNAGMLFDFQTPQRIVMWMKDTTIALDMLFLDDDGRVVAIAKNTVPLSLERIGIEDPVRAVLELRAGVTDRLKVRTGDRVCHRIYAQGAC